MIIRLFARFQESVPADGGDAGEGQPPAAAVTPPAKIEPPKVEPGIQKRINELTKARYEQQRRAEAAEARLAELEKAPRPASPSTTAADADRRKTLADFNFDEVAYDDYLEERATAKAEAAAAKKAKEAVEEHARETDRAKTAAERKAQWTQRVSGFKKDHPDFEAIVYAEDVDFSDAVAEALADSEIGPQLAYHLAQNPDEARRISKLSPAAAGREIGRLEAKLSVEAPAKEAEAEADETASAEEPPRTTKAPPPPPKLQVAASGSTRPATTSAQSDKLSDDDWFKAEQKRLAGLRKK